MHGRHAGHPGQGPARVRLRHALWEGGPVALLRHALWQVPPRRRPCPKGGCGPGGGCPELGRPWLPCITARPSSGALSKHTEVLRTQACLMFSQMLQK